MNLGAFSISLSVKDIDASAQFYAALGFQQISGDISQKWIILKNGECVIGLFEGMFDKNMLTFNPGWDQSGHNTENFDDIWELYKKFISVGLDVSTSSDMRSSGPAYFTITDPDGNPILFDQHR